MLSLRLTDEAEADLAQIWAYICEEASQASASQFLGALEVACRVLLHAPLIGAKREVFATGMRVTFHGQYAIYYRPGKDEIIVVRVLHGARDVAALAERGGFDGD